MKRKDSARRLHRACSSTLWSKSDTSHFCPQLIGQNYHMAPPNWYVEEQMDYIVSTLSSPWTCISPEATYQSDPALLQVDIDQKKFHMWIICILQSTFIIKFTLEQHSFEHVIPLKHGFFSINTIGILHLWVLHSPIENYFCICNWVSLTVDFQLETKNNVLDLRLIESVDAKGWL